MTAGIKSKLMILIGACALFASGATIAVLPTDQLIRLKQSGLGQDVIRYIVESDYTDVERVMKLKEAGFSDEVIMSIIRGDLRKEGETQLARPAQAQPSARPHTPLPIAEKRSLMQAIASVRIEEYMVRGEPIIKNTLELSEATVSLLEGNRLKIEWHVDAKTSVLDTFLRRKTFPSPFYWDLDKGDGLHVVDTERNAFVLRTGRTHPGMPATDGARYWIVYLTADTPELEKRIRAAVAE